MTNNKNHWDLGNIPFLTLYLPVFDFSNTHFGIILAIVLIILLEITFIISYLEY